MPKLTGVTVTATAALLLALTGCAGGTETPQEPAGDTSKPAASSPTGTPAPLVAETPAAGAEQDETKFVEFVRSEIRPDNVIPNATDQQLLEAGERACSALAEGVPSDQISVIEGEQASEHGYFTDSLPIIDGALRFLCPRD